tara:strand:- start:12207 stop:13463 length:1257 start_codon:yes stop_codon:yes gene_type:complete
MRLYDLLKNSVDHTGLPVMNSSQFIATTEKYGKEEFRKVLAEFITKEKPPYPLKKFNQEKVVQNFRKLQKADYTNYIDKSGKEVLEKYDDYSYPYSKYGLGVIDAPSTFNYVSDSFMNDLRMACGSYGFKSPIERWNEGDNIWGVFGPIWRGVNDSKSLIPETYTMAFRLGTYIATQFKPIVAKTFYEMCDAKTVLDTSMGWGDRLTAFYASNATHYIGCDPNPNTFERYKKMIEFYDKLTGGKKTVQMYRCGAEDLPWDKIKNVDCAFTSPPYFSTERYNEGGEHEEDQSWSRYDTYEKWRDNFYLPVSQKSFESLSDKGFLLVNILDPKVKGKRYHSGDDLVNSLKEHFIGQIGMRIMQRPQGKAVFSDDEGKFDKQKLNEFMNKIYIENVWCFGKDKNFDLFRHTKTGTLEEFFT